MFKIDASGVSDFTMEQTRAKASAMGLTDALTNELVAMAKDATFSEKAATGKLTWGQALKDGSISAEELGNALQNSNLVSQDAKDALDRVAKSVGTTDDSYKNLTKSIIEGANGYEKIADKAIDVGKNVEKSTGMFESAGNIIKGFFASIKGYIPIIVAIGAAFAAWKIFEYSQTGFTRATEKMNTSVSEYQEAAQELDSLNSKLDETKDRIAELQSLQSQGVITFDEEEKP